MSENSGFESVEMAGCDPPQSDRSTTVDMAEEVQSNRSAEVQNSDTAEDKEDDFSWEIKLKSIQYYRSCSNIDAKEILKLFKDWKMILPQVFFSVLSDSEFDSDTGVEQEAIQSNPKESVPAIRKTFCRSLVEVVAATEAWLITGGLNKGVDQLIGNEVKERLANWNKIPNVVIGITNRECIARQKNQLNDSHVPNGEESDIIPTGLSLNQHQTHCLLLDDATQRESGLECNLRQNVELALTEWQTKKTETSVISAQLIYILVGGRINALHVVKRAMDESLPVIIAVGTGGVADIISEAVSYKDGSILEYLPEIAEELFTHLGKLLVAEGFHANLARQIIADIKAENKLLFEIFELLSQTRRTYNVGARQFYKEISTLKKATTYELLVGIRDLLITKQTPLNSSSQSDDNADSDTVNRMRLVFEHVLFVNGIPQEKAEHAAKLLESTLNGIKVVFDDLKAIRTHDQKDLLIKYDISSTEKKTMPSLLVETLKKAKWKREKDLYMLFAKWDNETFFRELLLDNWMRLHHESVFTELLKKGKTKYVKLMMEYISNRTWLTKVEGPLMRNHENVFTELRKKRKRKDAKFMTKHISDNKWCTDLSGPLEKGFKKNRMCFNLLINIEASSNEVDRFRMKGKMLFIWFVLKGMHETAMLFWEQGQDCLAMALVAYDLSKKQQKNLKKRHDEMELQLKFFADLALDFLNKCLADNQNYTIGLLFKELQDLDNIVPYEIAMNANFEAFFCVDTIQDLVNEIWTTGIRNHDKCRYIPMILSLGCPLLAPALLDISSDDDDDEDNRNKQTDSKCQRVCNYFWKVLHFLDAPLVKFTYRFVSCIAHLTIFSIVMLTNFRTTISPLEIVLIVWTLSLIMEEGKQVVYDISGYISNGWNYLDLGALTMYIIGFILRMIYHSDPTRCPDCLYVARIILAFSLILFFLRALEFLAIIDATGPKIYMMRHLVADLVSILLIFAVFISAYGVVSNVILYPNQPLNVHLLRDVFHDAFWSVMQQFNLDGPAGSNCKNDNASSIFTKEYCSNMSDNNIDYQGCKNKGCPANTWIVSVLLAVYAIVTGIMLLNVLIAMFNDTFSKINENQKHVSKLQQHRLMHEYGDVSMVPSPLCVIQYIIVILIVCVACVPYLIISWDDNSEEGGSSSRQPESSSEAYEPSEKERWQKWELDLAAELCRENKDKEGWPAVRMTFETSNKFDENRWTSHIIQEIRKRMTEKQHSSEQLDEIVSEETGSTSSSLTEAIGETEKKVK